MGSQNPHLGPGPTKAEAGGEVPVSATNNSSIASKAATVNLGYFDDPYVKHFVKNIKRRAPIINRGYAIRYEAIDWAFREFIRKIPNDGQVLILGAGFDTLFFRARRDKIPFSKWVEVDYAEVMKRKQAHIEAQDSLREAAEDPRYKLLGANLLDLIQESPAEISKIMDLSKPTFILSEVVLTYLPTKDSNAVIKWTNDIFDDPHLVLYEQILPHTPFGRVMCKHFEKMGCAICPLYDYPLLQDQKNRFKELGYGFISYFEDLRHFKNNHLIKSSTVDRLAQWNQIEFFDEYEEWELKLSHYYLAIVRKGLPEDKDEDITPTETLPSIQATEVPMDALQRYSFAMKQIQVKSSSSSATVEEAATDDIEEESYLVAYGGFGPNKKNCHGRLHSASIFKTTDFSKVKDYTDPDDCKYPMSASILAKDKITRWNDELPSLHDLILPWGGRAGPKSIGSFLDDTRIGPSSRWRHAVARRNCDLVVIGGRGFDWAPVADVAWAYSGQFKEWTELHTIGPRHSVALCVLDERIIAFGGINKFEEALGEAVDIFSGESFPFPPTFGAQAVAYNNGAVVVHPLSSRAHEDASVTENESFRSGFLTYWAPTFTKTFRIQHHADFLFINYQICLLDEHRLCIVGGGGNLFSFGTHVNTIRLEIDLQNMILVEETIQETIEICTLTKEQ